MKHDRQLGKAGFIPYVIVAGQPLFMFMVPSDAMFGGTKPSVAKGMIDAGETAAEAAIREAEEELGLKMSNVKKDTVKMAWRGNIQALKAIYPMTIYMGQVKDQRDFNKPHFETGKTMWMSLEKFRLSGRKSHKIGRAHV